MCLHPCVFTTGCVCTSKRLAKTHVDVWPNPRSCPHTHKHPDMLPLFSKAVIVKDRSTSPCLPQVSRCWPGLDDVLHTTPIHYFRKSEWCAGQDVDLISHKGRVQTGDPSPLPLTHTHGGRTYVITWLLSVPDCRAVDICWRHFHHQNANGWGPFHSCLCRSSYRSERVRRKWLRGEKKSADDHFQPSLTSNFDRFFFHLRLPDISSSWKPCVFSSRRAIRRRQLCPWWIGAKAERAARQNWFHSTLASAAEKVWRIKRKSGFAKRKSLQHDNDSGIAVSDICVDESFL